MFSLIFLAILSFAPPEYWKEMNTIAQEGTKSGTGLERIKLWKAGWKMFLDHPIIGVGPNNYGVWLPYYYPGRIGYRMWGRAAHSVYVTILSEMGIVGVLLFLAMLIANWRDHRCISALEKKSTIYYFTPISTQTKETKYQEP